MNYDNPLVTGQVEASAKRWTLRLGLLLLALACGVLLYKILSKPVGSSSAKKVESCVKVGGTFDSRHNECKDIDEAKCKSIGGEFVKCGSMCRHSAKRAEPCPSVCDDYCEL